MQLADGVFLQRIGGKFTRDFTSVPPKVANFGITAGLSFGPQLNGKDAAPIVSRYPYLDGAELFSLDGEGLLQPWTEPAVYKLSGDILMLRGTPLQAVLAGGNIAFYDNGRFDLGGELRVVVPFLHWGLDGQVSGFLDTKRSTVQLSGTTTAKIPFVGEAKAQVQQRRDRRYLAQWPVSAGSVCYYSAKGGPVRGGNLRNWELHHPRSRSWGCDGGFAGSQRAPRAAPAGTSRQSNYRGPRHRGSPIGKAQWTRPRDSISFRRTKATYQ